LAIILHMLNFIFSFSPGFHLACCIKIIKFCSIFFFLFFPEPYLQGLGVILQLAPAIYGLVQLFIFRISTVHTLTNLNMILSLAL